MQLTPGSFSEHTLRAMRKTGQLKNDCAAAIICGAWVQNGFHSNIFFSKFNSDPQLMSAQKKALDEYNSTIVELGKQLSMHSLPTLFVSASGRMSRDMRYLLGQEICPIQLFYNRSDQLSLDGYALSHGNAPSGIYYLPDAIKTAKRFIYDVAGRIELFGIRDIVEIVARDFPTYLAQFGFMGKELRVDESLVFPKREG